MNNDITERLRVLNSIKKRASEQGDYKLFAQVSQDIREIEAEIKDYECRERKGNLAKDIKKSL
jgi:hypothetical protein